MVQPAHTAHACRFCRQKRSKCDGKNPCERCRRWKQPCVYDDRTKETKGDLRKERDELLSRDRDANAIFQALQSGDYSDDTMASLWSRMPLEQIASRLGEPSDSSCQPSSSEALPDEPSPLKLEDIQKSMFGNTIASPSEGNITTSPPPYTTGDASNRPVPDTFTMQSPNITSQNETEPTQTIHLSQEPWQLIGVDVPKVMSLLDVFFSWQYLPLLHVDHEALARDFLQGEQNSCSRALIRAILSLACRSIDGYDTASSYHVNLGDRLLHEAATLLGDPEETVESLPNAQAYGLTALHELGTTRKHEAVAHIESCVRMLLALHKEESGGELDVSTVTWSSPLSTCLQGSVALSRIIHLFFRSLHPPSLVDDNPKSEIASWLSPESNKSNEEVLKVLRTPTHTGAVTDEDRLPALFVTLTSSVYCFLSTLSVPVAELPPGLLDVFHSCLSQYTGLIAALQSLQISRTSFLFIHLVYHFSLLSLCRPFSHIPVCADAPIDFRAICLEAAQTILSLSKSYFEMVASPQIPVFVPLFAYAAGLISYELATCERATFQPPSISQESSTGSSRETICTESDVSIVNTTPISSPTSGGLSVPSEPGAKRKIHQISVSPFKSPIPTQARSEVSKAIECLQIMGTVFPMAREAEKHLKDLISGSTADTTAQTPDYGFPLPRA